LIGSVAQHLNIPYFALVMYCEMALVIKDAIFEQTEKPSTGTESRVPDIGRVRVMLF
jgi:hypothetical protein